ncbi:MAG: hypothetical protein OEZ32_08265 [Nitrospinota bacterium]|nr:hypothetical protein [Nitrospinota bacterium]
MKNLAIILVVAWSFAACASLPTDKMPGGDALAFDYDGTCSVTPELCVDFFRATHARGMRPLIITARSEALGGAVHDFAAGASVQLGFDVPVVFAGGQYKSVAAAKAGYQVAAICDNRSASGELMRMGIVYVCGATVPAPSLIERLQRTVFNNQERH